MMTEEDKKLAAEIIANCNNNSQVRGELLDFAEQQRIAIERFYEVFNRTMSWLKEGTVDGLQKAQLFLEQYRKAA